MSNNQMTIAEQISRMQISFKGSRMTFSKLFGKEELTIDQMQNKFWNYLKRTRRISYKN